MLVSRAINFVVSVIDLFCPGIGVHPLAEHLPGGRVLIGQHSRAYAGEDHVSQICLHVSLRGSDRVSRHIGEDLLPELRFGRAARDQDALPDFRPRALHRVPQGKGDRFEQRAVHMGAGVAEGESQDDSPRVRIPDGAALSHKIGQRDQPLAPGGQRFRLPVEYPVGVLPAFRLHLFFQPREIVAEPLDQRARRRSAAKRVGERLCVLDVGHLNESAPVKRTVVHQRRAHRRADRGRVLSGFEDSESQRGDDAVDAARAHRRPGQQSQLGRRFRGESPHHLARLHNPFGHHPLGDSHCLQHLIRPFPLRLVENPADIARGRIVDCDLPRELVYRVGVRRQEQPDPFPVFRFVLLDPEDLRIPVVGIGPIVGDLIDPLPADLLRHPAILLSGTPVHPDEAGAHRFHPFVQRDPGPAVKAADADALYRFRGDPGLPHGAPDRRPDRVDPHLRPLLRPEGPRGQQVVFHVVGSQQGARRIHHDCLGARGADVGSNQTVHADSSLPCSPDGRRGAPCVFRNASKAMPSRIFRDILRPSPAWEPPTVRPCRGRSGSRRRWKTTGIFGYPSPVPGHRGTRRGSCRPPRSCRR